MLKLSHTRGLCISIYLNVSFYFDLFVLVAQQKETKILKIVLKAGAYDTGVL